VAQPRQGSSLGYDGDIDGGEWEKKRGREVAWLLTGLVAVHDSLPAAPEPVGRHLHRIVARSSNLGRQEEGGGGGEVRIWGHRL
jgi:hypothetical protein